jgi:DNA-directed RNA polymerase subunit L
VEIVQKMEHHSLANALKDILVSSAKCQVSILFKNVLAVCFSLSHFFPGKIFVELNFIS